MFYHADEEFSTWNEKSYLCRVHGNYGSDNRKWYKILLYSTKYDVGSIFYFIAATARLESRSRLEPHIEQQLSVTILITPLNLVNYSNRVFNLKVWSQDAIFHPIYHPVISSNSIWTRFVPCDHICQKLKAKSENQWKILMHLIFNWLSDENHDFSHWCNTYLLQRTIHFA